MGAIINYKKKKKAKKDRKKNTFQFGGVDFAAAVKETVGIGAGIGAGNAIGAGLAMAKITNEKWYGLGGVIKSGLLFAASGYAAKNKSLKKFKGFSTGLVVSGALNLLDTFGAVTKTRQFTNILTSIDADPLAVVPGKLEGIIAPVAIRRNLGAVINPSRSLKGVISPGRAVRNRLSGISMTAGSGMTSSSRYATNRQSRPWNRN